MTRDQLIEHVGKALAKEEGYAYDPLPYDNRARAAIEAIENLPKEEDTMHGSSDQPDETYVAEMHRCPFCGEADFDLIGLKHHFAAGWCEPFNETPMFERKPIAKKEDDAR